MRISDKIFSGKSIRQAASHLDDKERCCGKKPIKYKTNGGPHYFCTRCDRAFSLETKFQIPNWAWKFETAPDRFVRTRT